MRAKSIITFIIISIVTLGSAFELCVAVVNISLNSPIDIENTSFEKSHSEQHWIGAGRGRQKVTITSTYIDGKHAIIIGDFDDVGWLLPPLHKSKFEEFAKEALILQHFSWHPYIRYSVGALVCLTICYFGSRVALDIFKDIIDKPKLSLPNKTLHPTSDPLEIEPL